MKYKLIDDRGSYIIDLSLIFLSQILSLQLAFPQFDKQAIEIDFFNPI